MDGLGCAAVILLALAVIGFFLYQDHAEHVDEVDVDEG